VRDMFVIYMVTTDGIGVFGIVNYDMTRNPSECYWLIPGTEYLEEL
jgi:hypothetical protein